ncbi:MAG: ribosome small subunit-dependent GTPase A [Burkholderiales bacterium]|jgi:ribosome biogenesis GTPase|nr:ribosome small subunit-dependent GTPase A [Burkholderiales bacterium]
MKPPLLHGTVVAAFGRSYEVALDAGERLQCLPRGKRSDIACGDRVALARTGPGQGVIEAADPRSSLLWRSDAFRQKLIAANVTQIVVVLAVWPAWYEELLNRCLVAAEHARIAATIVLNKVDLPQAPQVIADLADYTRLGYPLLPMSAAQSVEALRARLDGHTSVLVGQSGMGKTTIVNALVPDACAAVGEVSEWLVSGRHTTTHARLYALDDRTRLIDSPGLQAFGLAHLSQTDLDHAFVEFRPFIGRCRFANCRHAGEPGCAIDAAAADGAIAPRRLAAYRTILGTLSAA